MRVGPYYLIDTDGSIIQFVSEDDVGVHIGMFFQICFLKIVLFYHNIRHSNPFR